MVGLSYIIQKVLRVHSEIEFVCLSVCLSVCTTIFKRIAGLCFYPKSLMFYNICLNLSRQALQNNEKIIWNSEIVSELMTENRKIFKLIARREYWFNYNMLYVNGFVPTSSTNLWKAFFKFRICFRIIDRKPKNIQMNRKAWILIRVQCVVYQWIRLDKLYRLMECFFLIFWNHFRINYNFLKWWYRWFYVCEMGAAFVLISTRCNVLEGTWVHMWTFFQRTLSNSDSMK